MSKTALVVDDSRVALHTLARLLKPKGLLVDMVESGPEAIDYLRRNPPPGAVFLDHMMPGMDGFETLAALKADKRTASIPIVMYTSHDGDAYMDEARALGAVDVLYKPVQPEQLDRILTALHFSGSETARTLPPEPVRVASSSADTVPSTTVTIAPVASRTLPPQAYEVSADNDASDRLMPIWPFVVLALLLSASSAWLFQKYRVAETALADAQTQNARLKKELTEQIELTQKANALVTTLSTPVTQTAPPRPLLNLVVWAINRQSRYDYGETPLNDDRAALLRQLLDQLIASDFRGVVRVTTHVGEFCLNRDKEGNYRVPAPGTPFSRCEIVSYRPAEAFAVGNRRTEAFARVIGEHAQARTPIEVVIASQGTNRPLQAYPDTANLRMASEWNAVARFNQRVEITLESR